MVKPKTEPYISVFENYKPFGFGFFGFGFSVSDIESVRFRFIFGRGEHGAGWGGFMVKPKTEPNSLVFEKYKPFGFGFFGFGFSVFDIESVRFRFIFGFFLLKNKKVLILYKFYDSKFSSKNI